MKIRIEETPKGKIAIVYQNACVMELTDDEADSLAFHIQTILQDKDRRKKIK